MKENNENVCQIYKNYVPLQRDLCLLIQLNIPIGMDFIISEKKKQQTNKQTIILINLLNK